MYFQEQRKNKRSIELVIVKEFTGKVRRRGKQGKRKRRRERPPGGRLRKEPCLFYSTLYFISYFFQKIYPYQYFLLVYYNVCVIALYF